LVEDIIDSGKTYQFLRDHLLKQNPASLKVCSLLFKPLRPELRAHIHYLGFTVPDDYYVGYGMDFKGEYRHLPYIGLLSDYPKDSSVNQE